MSRQFQRRIEDFVCGNCSLRVGGSGYTNHCPRCLWSRHVDIHPGDRVAECRGMMAPVQIDGTSDGYRILHLCTKCGVEKWNQAESSDSFEALIGLAERHGKHKIG